MDQEKQLEIRIFALLKECLEFRKAYVSLNRSKVQSVQGDAPGEVPETCEPGPMFRQPGQGPAY